MRETDNESNGKKSKTQTIDKTRKTHKNNNKQSEQNNN